GEPLRVHADDGTVEGAGPEVVDADGPGVPVPETRIVRGGGHGFGNQPDIPEPRLVGGGPEDILAGGTPPGGVRDPRLRGPPPQLPFGFLTDPAQNGRDGGGDAD